MFYNKRIKFIREFKGWSLQELADKCEISKQALWKIEKGENSPTIETLVKIAKAFSLSLDAFSAPFVVMKFYENEVYLSIYKPENTEQVTSDTANSHE